MQRLGPAQTALLWDWGPYWFLPHVHWRNFVFPQNVFSVSRNQQSFPIFFLWLLSGYENIRFAMCLAWFSSCHGQKGHFLHVYPILDSVAMETHSLAGKGFVFLWETVINVLSHHCVCVCFGETFFPPLFMHICVCVQEIFSGWKGLFLEAWSWNFISDASSTTILYTEQVMRIHHVVSTGSPDTTYNVLHTLNAHFNTAKIIEKFCRYLCLYL